MRNYIRILTPDPGELSKELGFRVWGHDPPNNCNQMIKKREHKMETCIMLGFMGLHGVDTLDPALH